jgi:hypothetical protein
MFVAPIVFAGLLLSSIPLLIYFKRLHWGLKGLAVVLFAITAYVVSLILELLLMIISAFFTRL